MDSDDDTLPPDSMLATFRVAYSITKESILVGVDTETAKFEPPWVKHGLVVILPVGEQRPVTFEKGTTSVSSLESIDSDELGRKRYRLTLTPGTGRKMSYV